MSKSVSDLLNEMNVDDCVVSLLSTIKNKMRNAKSMHLNVLQYFIDIMGCSHKLTLKDLEFKQTHLALIVYNSRTDKEVESVNTAQFINLLIDNASEKSLLDGYLYACVGFLLVYSNHQSIPQDASSVGVALQLLSYHLQPLTTRFLNIDIEDLLDQEGRNIEEVLTETLTVIMQISIPRGLELDHEFREEIGLQFVSVMEENCETFTADGWNFLYLYRNFFTDANTGLLLIGIQSVYRLFDNKAITPQLQTFFQEVDQHGQSVMDMLESSLKLSTSQNISSSIIRLLLLVESHKKGSLSKETLRLEIYRNKMLKETTDDWNDLFLLMRRLEDDLLLAIVRMFVKVEASQDIIRRFTETFLLKEPLLIPKLIEIVTNNINDSTEQARRAAQIFEVALKKKSGNQIVIINEKAATLLKTCSRDEQTFRSVFTLLTINASMKIVAKSPHKDNEVGTILIDSLFTAFASFRDPLLLQNIMLTLVKLDKILDKQMKMPLKQSFESLYETYLQAGVQAVNGEVMSDSSPIHKMTLLMESNLGEFMDYFQYEAVTIINTKHLTDSNNPIIFPYVARFQKSVLHAMWSRIYENKMNSVEQILVPYNLKFIAASVKDLTVKLLKLMSNRDMDLFTAQLVFCCLVQLLHSFEILPKCLPRTSTVLFMTNPKVSLMDMRAIVGFTVHYVFKVNTNDSSDVECQKNILKGLSSLVQNYSSLPSLQTLFKVIRYLSVKSVFTVDLEKLLKVLSNFKHLFPTIIGLAILSLPSIVEIEEFVGALLKHLKAWNDLDGKSSIKWKICEFLLKSMKSATRSASNRINLLAAIVILGETVDSEALAKLQHLVPQDMFEANEQKQLESFLDILTNVVTIN